jgi:hypothetical protein
VLDTFATYFTKTIPRTSPNRTKPAETKLSKPNYPTKFKPSRTHESVTGTRVTRSKGGEDQSVPGLLRRTVRRLCDLARVKCPPPTRPALAPARVTPLPLRTTASGLASPQQDAVGNAERCTALLELARPRPAAAQCTVPARSAARARQNARQGHSARAADVRSVAARPRARPRRARLPDGAARRDEPR